MGKDRKIMRELNLVLWKTDIAKMTKKQIYKSFVQTIMFCVSEIN